MPEEFLDEYLPDALWGYPTSSAPRTKTTITRQASGHEKRNRDRLHPLHVVRIPVSEGRRPDVIDDLRDHWMVVGGPAIAFPFRDPMDFASVRVASADNAPVISGSDVQIGIGDGQTAAFQISKIYSRGPMSYTRPITLPQVASVLVSLDGVLQASGWSVSRPGGVVTFDVAPDPAVLITAGFFFDIPVRFSSDEDFESIVRAPGAGGVADIELTEVRLCL